MAKRKGVQLLEKIASYQLTIMFMFVFIPVVRSQVPCENDPSVCGNLSFCPNNGTCRCVDGAYSQSGHNNDCLNSSIPDASCAVSKCLYCSTATCIRCVDPLILYTAPNGIQECYTECPRGTSPEVNAAQPSGVQRRICSGVIEETTSSIDQTVLIAVICVIVGILFLMSLAFALYCIISFIRGRRSRGFEVQDSASTDVAYIQENVGATKGASAITGRTVRDPHDVEFSGNNRQSMMFEDEDYNMFNNSGHSEEMIVFLNKLNGLRKHSTDFLRMLNDMRRRLKELPTESSAAKSYRNVMGDVTRLLFLLNKKPGNIEMPPDGLQLLEWSEQTLKHYLDSQKRAVARKQQQEQSERSSSPSSNPRLSSYGGQAETHF